MPVKSKVKISQNFVAFSEYMNFNNQIIVGLLRVLNSLELSALTFIHFSATFVRWDKNRKT